MIRKLFVYTCTRESLCCFQTKGNIYWYRHWLSVKLSKIYIGISNIGKKPNIMHPYLKQKSCKKSIVFKFSYSVWKIYYTLINKSVHIHLFNLQVSWFVIFVYVSYSFWFKIKTDWTSIPAVFIQKHKYLNVIFVFYVSFYYTQAYSAP